ncbi:FixH family protein [Niabella hirudinis]|uniref:FixH family protein n=1 Tax=Niabella hirudinis TaxID=1285929 RepID=UPI003EB69EF8
MSWGYRVIIIMGLFLAGMITMVGISMQQTNEMIDANYYEKELVYQNVIDAKQRLHATGSKVTIAASADSLRVLFPPALSAQISTGSISFLKLSDSKNDRKISMEHTAAAAYSLPVKDMQKGWYKVRVQWVNSGQMYYQEQSFLLN